MSRPLRIIQWGTGNTGLHSLRFLRGDPTLEVVGVWVGRGSNVGRTADELIGIGVGGPVATNDAASLLALDADCVVYMPAEPKGSLARPGTDGWESLETICRLLATGKNIVSTGISGLTNPHAYGIGVYGRLEAASKAGASTFFGTGIEPGFMCDALALNSRACPETSGRFERRR